MSRRRPRPPADQPLGPIRRGTAELALYMITSVGACGTPGLMLLQTRPLMRGWRIAATIAFIVPAMVAVIHHDVPPAPRTMAHILAQG